MSNNQCFVFVVVVVVVDELAIEMSSKAGLAYLTAAYRMKVLLFLSVSAFVPVAYYFVY